MRILITGGSGFLGARLARTLLSMGAIEMAGAATLAIDELWLTDLAPPPADLQADPRVRFVGGELNALLHAGTLSLDGVVAVVHLAAAVSGDCEADLDLGLRSNIDATLALLQGARRQGQAPVFIYASSVAVFGGMPGQPLPTVVEDHTLPTPQGSYGIQKFIGEQLVADFTRRGLVQGRSVRLMTVAVRPGRPNGAASGFLSGMVREPLAGQRAVVPVAPETPVALASPGRTVEGLLMALRAGASVWGPRTAVNLPALATTVGEIATALAQLAGPAATDLLDWQPDARVAGIVGGWPSRFDAARARAMGLLPDASVGALLAAYVADHPDAVSLPLNGNLQETRP
ncbi:MAG: NAD-dependent epimerase/dehydratase family protein [Vitreoscilla sp.]|nr:NAD-dependent epimerase/dehydratase family protein [Vitreoscilla sp.]